MKSTKKCVSAALLVLGLGLAGCADNGNAAAGKSDVALADVDLSVAVRYTGGTARPADDGLKPVKIGWVNEEGGATSQPEATAGVRAAVSLINDSLGGIGGRRVELVECFVASSEEEGQQCAQKMHNDDDIALVLTGSTSVAAGSLHNVLAQSKPILGSTPSSPSDLTAENSYYVGAGPFGQSALAKYLIDHENARKIALIGPDFAGTTIALDTIKKVAEPAGATVSAGTYKQGSADVSPAVLASKAREADAILVLEPTGAGCASVAKALAQYAVTAPVLSLSSCAEEETVGAALGDLPKWTFPLPTLIPSTSVKDDTGEAAVYLGAMTEYQPKASRWGLAPANFSLGIYAARILNGLGGVITPEAVSSALKAGTGPVFMATPTLKFGGPLPAVGSTSFRFYTYEGEGNWKIAADGEWVS
ncbi:ABC transporter substrate-binding protein [Pseudonocardia sp. CA-107938]|uniref:ABC transporter substrate-binding protein n=1 Tax=Pseudonocardia sp. CA-107938 TaxID=3240021 RepID=UPI003D8B1644